MTTTRFTLRTVSPEDHAFLRDLYASTREEELNQVAWLPGQREAFLDSQFTAQSSHYQKHYPGATLSIIEVDGVRAGRFYLHQTSKEIRIMDIALVPAFRRQGIGTRLLEQTFAQANHCGLPVTIHVEKWNPAQNLYYRLGFRSIADRGAYWFLEKSPESQIAWHEAPANSAT